MGHGHPQSPLRTQLGCPSPTVLSSPRVIIIRKKMMAKKVDPTMLAIASG